MADPTAAWVDPQGRSPCRGVALTFEAWSVASRVGRRVQVVVRGQDSLQEVPRSEGERAKEPSLTLPWQLLEGLLAALPSKVTTVDAIAAHLEDAIEVRDRLLTIVERGAK